MSYRLAPGSYLANSCVRLHQTDQSSRAGEQEQPDQQADHRAGEEEQQPDQQADHRAGEQEQPDPTGRSQITEHEATVSAHRQRVGNISTYSRTTGPHRREGGKKRRREGGTK